MSSQQAYRHNGCYSMFKYSAKRHAIVFYVLNKTSEGFRQRLIHGPTISTKKIQHRINTSCRFAISRVHHLCQFSVAAYEECSCPFISACKVTKSVLDNGHSN